LSIPFGQAAARLKRPEFLLLCVTTAGLIAWFFATLPAPLRDADQIANTTILLGVLAFYLVFDFRPKFAETDQSFKPTLGWVAAGILLAGLSLLIPPGFESIFAQFAAICCFLRATGGALLDPSGTRLLNALFIAFAVFGALLVSLPFLDYPLRIIAGRWSAQIFDLIHQKTELGFVVQNDVPMLLLSVNGRLFHVAAECNGFGLLGTSIIFTSAIVFYRRVSVFDSILLTVAAAFLALVGNLFRILIIISLAPLVGEHYLLMHEIVGTIMFYGFLGIQLWLIVGFGRSPRRTDDVETP